MRSRHALVAVVFPLLAAGPASASILSATSQTVGTRPSSPDYLRVTVVQDELNKTMRDMNEASTATGSISEQAPAIGEGAYVLQKEGTGGTRHSRFDDLIVMPEYVRDGGRISIPETGALIRGTRPGHFDSDRRGNRNRRDDPHAAPEPSTWLLLGTGLAMLGGFAMLRRHTAAEN